MIKLEDALLTDSIPEVIGRQPWAQAIAKAVRKQMRRLIGYADRTTLYAAIDNLPDGVLDIMAADLRVPQYSDSYSIAIKRSLIKGASSYWSQAGTRAAVESLCRDIFGDAVVSEWYEYGGEPGYFKVSTTNPAITEENVSEFKAAVEAVKRLSAWIDTVELILSAPGMTQVTGFYISTADTVRLKQTT